MVFVLLDRYRQFRDICLFPILPFSNRRRGNPLVIVLGLLSVPTFNYQLGSHPPTPLFPRIASL